MLKLSSFYDAEVKKSGFELLRIEMLGGISAMLIELAQWQPPQAKEDLVLADIITTANGTPVTQDKIAKLEELVEELSSLISCPAYGEDLERCKICREICKMRRQRLAANLCSIYEKNGYNHKTRLTSKQFKNLPSEIEQDLRDSKNLQKIFRG